MQTTSTQSTTNAPATIPSQPSTDRGMSTLGSADFFKMLISELKQQDPLSPSKTSDMISQVSQIRSIELSGKLTDTLDQLSKQQRTAGATDLIGKYVRATTTIADGTQQSSEGFVTGVKFNTDGSTTVELDSGQSVLLSNVTSVSTGPDTAGSPGAAPSSPGPAAQKANSGKPKGAIAKVLHNLLGI